MKKLILILMFVPNLVFAGGSETGGPGFVVGKGGAILMAHQVSFNEVTSKTFYLDDLVIEASNIISGANNDLTQEIASSYDHNLTKKIVKILAKEIELTADIVKISIELSLRATVFINYAGYEEDAAINSVLESFSPIAGVML